MPRRIEVELTSSRDDGTWTWRAAGARQPKGELEGRLLPAGAKIGDVLRAEADFDVDGITVTAVLPPKGGRREPERLEIIGPPRDEQLVTTVLARGGSARTTGRRGGSDRRGPSERRGPRRERADRPPREGDGTPARPSSDRASRPPRRERAPRRERPPRPEPEPRPKAKRLRAGREHRNEVLASLPEEQKPIAEQVLRGGIPGVRQAVDKQNEAARESGAPEIKADGVVSIAEQLLPRLRTAEWHDKADAAMADVDEVSLADLRSVVVAADVAARDDTTRELATQLREALTRRVEHEHAAWLTELAETLASGRTVRALRLSSRPPKAGSPLPPDLSTRLAEAAGAALTAETAPDRFATVLDALAYSPVRSVVVPQGVPAEPGDALLTAVRKLSSRLPQIAAAFGVEATSSPRRPRGPRSGPRPVPAPPVLPEPTAAPTEPAATGSEPEVAPAPPVAEAEAEVVLDPPVEPEPAATGSEPEAGPTPPVVAEAEPTPPVVAEAEPTPPVVAEPESSAQPESPTEAEPSAEAEPTP